MHKQPKNPYLMGRDELTIHLNKIRNWLFDYGMGRQPHPRTREVETAFERAYQALETYDDRLQDPFFALVCEILG